MAEPMPKVRNETQDHAPKRVFVEMGMNELPVPWIGERIFGPDDLYVGVDLESSSVQTSKRTTEVERREEGKSSQNMLFVRADAQRMPIQDHVAEEVFLGNVLGDPSIPDNNKDHFVAEARRIVSNTGTVVIKENNTPADMSFVRDLLQKHGLKVKKIVDSNSPEWPDAVRPYHVTASKQGAHHFKIHDYIIFANPETMQ